MKDTNLEELRRDSQVSSYQINRLPPKQSSFENAKMCWKEVATFKLDEKEF